MHARPGSCHLAGPAPCLVERSSLAGPTHSSARLPAAPQSLVSACGGGSAAGGAPAMSGTAPGEPALAVTHTPGASGTKEQPLPDHVGILITGCQSHETSADACPSGNPKEA